MSVSKLTGAKAKVGGLVINGTELGATATEIDAVVDMSALGGVRKVKAISITAAGSTAEQDSGWDLPASALIAGPVSVWAQITAAATAGAVLDVGLLSSSSGGDADGFLDGVGTSSTGIKTFSLTMTASSSGFASTTAGVLLEKFVADGAGAPGGHAHPLLYASDSVTAKSVSWTLLSTGTALTGRIFIEYTELSS